MAFFIPTTRRLKKIDLIALINSILNITNIESIDLIDLITRIQLIDEITKLGEITVIKNIESIETMPDATPRGSEGLAFKQDALGVGGWVSPTSHVEGDWEGEAEAYDDNETTYAWTSWSSGWSPFIELTHAEMESSKLRYKLKVGTGSISKIDVDVFKDGDWLNVYEGSFAQNVWIEKSFTQGAVTKLRLRFYCAGGYNVLYFYEADFWEEPIEGGVLWVVLIAWDGSNYVKVRCDPDGYLLTKAG